MQNSFENAPSIIIGEVGLMNYDANGNLNMTAPMIKDKLANSDNKYQSKHLKHQYNLLLQNL